MTGSALFDFLIAIVVLGGVVALFIYAIEGISPNAQFTRIAQLAVGVAALVVLLLALKDVFFGKGTVGLSVSPLGLIHFAIGVIVVLVVLYLVKLFVNMFVPQFAEAVIYVVGAVALIALLLLAAAAFFGGSSLTRPFLKGDAVPSLTYPARTTAHL